MYQKVLYFIYVQKEEKFQLFITWRGSGTSIMIMACTLYFLSLWVLLFLFFVVRTLTQKLPFYVFCDNVMMTIQFCYAKTFPFSSFSLSCFVYGNYVIVSNIRTQNKYSHPSMNVKRQKMGDKKGVSEVFSGRKSLRNEHKSIHEHSFFPNKSESCGW